MKIIQLRDYQQSLLTAVQTAFNLGQGPVCLQLPTGGGKTETGIKLCQNIIGQYGLADVNFWFVVHRRDLIDQVAQKLKDHQIEPSFIASKLPYVQNNPFHVVSIQSLIRRMMGDYKAPTVIIIDECHHATSKSYQNLFKYAEDLGIPVLGLTATPRRLDRRPMKPPFKTLICGLEPMELINQGWLAQPEIFVPPKSVAAVEEMREHWHTDMGDYKTSEVDADLKNNQLIYGDAIAHYQEYAKDESALVFCVSVNHAHNAAAEFQAAGIPAEAIDGTMDDDERKAILNRFRNRQTLALMSNNLLLEGLDVPLASVCIMLRPTQSLTVWLQAIGRVLRPFGSKLTAKIFDHVNNGRLHGPPWIKRFWTLDAYNNKPVTDKLTGVNLKPCGWCGHYVASNVRVCKYCGYQFIETTKTNKKSILISTKLVKLSPGDVLAREKRKMAKTKEELRQYAEERGWNNPEAWAEKAFKQQQEDDRIFLRGTEAELVMLYTRRKNADPIKKAKEVLARRAELAQDSGRAEQDEVFRNGDFDTIKAFVLKQGKVKPEGVENYTRAILKNRLKTVLDNGTRDEVIEAAKLMKVNHPEAYADGVFKQRSLAADETVQEAAAAVKKEFTHADYVKFGIEKKGLSKEQAEQFATNVLAKKQREAVTA